MASHKSPADLVTFTEKVLNGKLFFLYSGSRIVMILGGDLISPDRVIKAPFTFMGRSTLR